MVLSELDPWQRPPAADSKHFRLLADPQSHPVFAHQLGRLAWRMQETTFLGKWANAGTGGSQCPLHLRKT